MTEFEGAVRPSAVEKEAYDGSLQAFRHTEAPSGYKMRLDYVDRTDGQPVYQGFAPTGLAEGSNGWVIYKFTYDGSNNMTQRDIYGAGTDLANWTARASYTYD